MVLSKKKSVRAAQRGAVKKTIAKIEDELREEDGTSESELLRALCDTLRKKKDMLAEMDREILEETSEERMEEEIDDSDGYVLAIDRALNKVQIRSEQTVPSVSNLSARNLNPNANEFVQIRHNQSHHKLPKLNLPYFDGNLLQWQTFWDTFETSIHEKHLVERCTEIYISKKSSAGSSRAVHRRFAVDIRELLSSYRHNSREIRPRAQDY